MHEQLQGSVIDIFNSECGSLLLHDFANYLRELVLVDLVTLTRLSLFEYLP
jgi:hypothetical protein